LPLDSLLELLANPSNEISSPEFAVLSDLTFTELEDFRNIWNQCGEDQQTWIVSTLVEMGEEGTELDFSSIFKLGLKSDQEIVISKCIEGLWEYEDRSVIPEFIEILFSNNPANLRASAAESLGKFADLSQDNKLLQTDADMVYESLMSVLSDESEHTEVRRRSLESASGFRSQEVQEYIKWAYSSGDSDLKSSSIYAMGQSGETIWLPILLIELKNIEPFIRYESARACGALGEDDVVPHLEQMLQDEDNQVQLAAIEALGNIGGNLAKQILSRLSEDCEPEFEQSVALALESAEFLQDSMDF
jgi:HEAT repeat protein